MMFLTAKKIGKIGLAFSLAAVLLACSGGEGRQEKYLERAQEHFDSGNMEKALIDVKNVVQINEKNPEAHYLWALIAEQDQDWRTAFGRLNLTVELDPAHAKATIKLAQLSLAANQMDRARTLAATGLELAPDNADALAVMAGITLKDGDREEAAVYASRSLEINPGQITAIAILAVLQGEGNPERALEIIDAGIAVTPEEARLHLLRIRYLEALDRTDEVIAQFKKLISIMTEPENTQVIGQLAGYYVAKIRADEAEELLRGSIKEQPENDELKVYLIKFLNVNAGREAAIVELESMLVQQPENFKVRRMLAELLVAESDDLTPAETVLMGTFDHEVSVVDAQSARNILAKLARKQGDIEKANKWIAEALEVEPENPDALLSRAGISLAAGKHREAIPDLRMILRSSPDSVSAMLLLAEAQKKDGSTSLALDNYRTVLKMQPENSIALYQSANLMAAQQDYDNAIVNLEKLLEADPVNIPAINLLTGVYSQQGRWDEANSLLENLAGNEGTEAVADLLGSGVELRQGNFDRSIELANSALERNSALTGAVPIAARAYAAKGDLPGAIEYVEFYSAKHPGIANFYDILAQLYFSNKQPEKSIDTLKKSIEVAPQRIGTYISLARIYVRQGSLEKLEGLYKQGIAANPENVLLRVELSARYQMKGDYDEALAVLEEAYALDENSQPVINNLVTVLIDYFPTEENLRRAQQITLGFEDSKNPAQLDTLGWLQYHLDSIPQAISLFEAARAAGGQGVDYWYHLGLAYAKNGQAELAKAELEKVLVDEYAAYHGRANAEEVYNSL